MCCECRYEGEVWRVRCVGVYDRTGMCEGEVCVVSIGVKGRCVR